MPEGTHFPALLDDAELALILAGDDLDELRELHDRLSDQLGAVKNRIWELEQVARYVEWRDMRSNYRPL
jgi:hypothetical protein